MSKSNILSWKPDHDTSFCDNEDIVLIKPEFLTIWALEGIIVEDEEKDLLTDIYYGNYHGKSYTEALTFVYKVCMYCRVV